MKKPTPGLLVFLLLAALSAGVWIHRIHIDRPSGHALLVNSDVFRYFYPTADYLHDELRRGHLPLWNPYQYAGQPFLGLHVTAALYPPNLVLMGLLRAGQALAAHAILHTLVAGCFTWLFAARLGLGRAACLAAAVAYMLSAPLRLGIYMVPFLSNAAWLPAILWALHGLLTEVRASWAVGLAAFLSLAFLSGHAQGFVYEAQFALAYGLFGLAFVAPRGRRLRVVGLALASGVLALGFVAPQLLPALEFTREAVRSFEGVSFAQASRAAARPRTLLWGTLGQLGLSHLPGTGGLTLLPTATLPLVLIGVLARRQRAHWVFFLVAAGVIAVLLLGPHTPAFRFYYSLPLGNLFRRPLRMAFLYVFLAAMLAAIGIHGVTERLPGSPVGRRLAGTLGVLLALLIGAELYGRSKLALAHPVLSAPISGAPASLIQYLRSQPGRGRLFVERTKGFPHMLFEKIGMMHRVFVIPDYEPAMPKVYEQYFATKQSRPWHGNLSVLPRGRRQTHDVLGKRLDLMSAPYYAVLQPMQPETERTLQAFAGGRRVSVGPVEVFERPTALPRVYTVRRVRYARDVESALERIDDDTFQPRREAIIVAPDRAGEPGLGTEAILGNPELPEGNDMASVTRYTTEEVTIAAVCRSNCLLVLTDLYYPGWRVYVDGHEKTIHRVNALFRGVQLEAGAHEVVYRYEPRSFRLGVWMLLAALLGTAGLVYAGRDSRSVGSG